MRHACALALAVLCTAILYAEDARPRLDGDGEPLPPGARFRLGTRLWRHTGECSNLAWSPDGKLLATASREGARIRDAASGKILVSIDAPHTRVLAFSPDGKELACGSLAGGVVAYDPASGREVRPYPVNARQQLAYSPKGTYLIAVEETNYVVLNRATGRKVLDMETRAEIMGCAFSADETRLVVSSFNPAVKIWDIPAGKVLKEWTIEEKWFIGGPAVSPDGKQFAVGKEGIVVVDADTLETKQHLVADDPLKGFLLMQYTSDGKLLVAVSRDGEVYVWDTATYERRWKLTGNVQFERSMAVDPAGKRVAVGDAFNRIWIWDLETGKRLFDVPVGHHHEVYAVDWSRDGALIATGSGGLTTHLWDARSGRHLRTLPTSSYFLRLSPDGGTLLSTWHNRQPLRVWDTKSATEQQQWPMESEGSMTFALSADRSRLVRLERLPGDDWRFTGYAFPSLEEQFRQSGKGPVHQVTISPSGKLVAFNVYNEGIRIFSFDQAKFVTTLPYEDWNAEGKAFTPDDRFFLIGGDIVQVFELATGKIANSFDKHNRPVGALAVSPNGRIAASTDGQTGRPKQLKDPHRIRFWDIATCRELATLSGHDVNATSLCFSPDGTQLITGLQDATALVWDVPEEARRAAVTVQAIAAEEIEAVWHDLSSTEAAAGQRAVLRLVNDPDSAVALLEERLKPVAAPDDKEVQSLITGLEDDDFKVRQASLDRLAAYGAVITHQLTAAARDAESNEVRLRCRELLQAAQSPLPLRGEALTAARAVQVLEWVGTTQAKALLGKLATGAAEAQLTRESRAALGRLK
jgi:WD40 repeat protein